LTADTSPSHIARSERRYTRGVENATFYINKEAFDPCDGGDAIKFSAIILQKKRTLRRIMLMVKNIFEKVFFYALKNSSRLRRHKNKYSKKNLHAHTTQCIGLNHKNKIAKVCLTKTFDLYYYYYLS